MKGIETRIELAFGQLLLKRSDHCPAMKGIETRVGNARLSASTSEATTAPQ